MHSEVHKTVVKAHRPASLVKTEPRATSPVRQTEPSGLTREELRKIIIDLIG